jgi:hypothetical protein
MAELLQALDAYGSRIPLDRLAAHLEATSLCFEDVKAQAVFGERTYRGTSSTRGRPTRP